MTFEQIAIGGIIIGVFVLLLLFTVARKAIRLAVRMFLAALVILLLLAGVVAGWWLYGPTDKTPPRDSNRPARNSNSPRR